ncbi:CAP domain-containing protein [Rothia sp. CCM 9419]|uniref:CAP domain-containing protein n=1 Tax=Rothia sp. CCM 9419 TaxID=3402662 RepID=UPI003ADF6512
MSNTELSSLKSLLPNRRQVGKIALAGLGATALGSTAAQAAYSDIRRVSTAYRNADAQRLLNLINQYRAQYGLQPLQHSATVASVMDIEARRQFIQGYFSHGTQFMYNPKVRGYSFVREVIALSYNGDISQLLAFWKSSPPHRAAILAPQANTCGIGLCYGNGRGLPWRVLGNVGIYRYERGRGPSDIQPTIAGGSRIATQSTQPTYAIKGGIGASYHNGGGEARFGVPIMNEKGGLVEGGIYQNYSKNGNISQFLWTADTGAYPVHFEGDIGRYWARHGEENVLGYPLMYETGGLIGGGAYQRFKRGNRVTKIMWHPRYGAHPILEYGAISAEWSRNDYERGYGYPVTGEYRHGIEVHQRFSKGYTIAWHSRTGRVRAFKS